MSQTLDQSPLVKNKHNSILKGSEHRGKAVCNSDMTECPFPLMILKRVFCITEAFVVFFGLAAGGIRAQFFRAASVAAANSVQRKRNRRSCRARP